MIAPEFIFILLDALRSPSGVLGGLAALYIAWHARSISPMWALAFIGVAVYSLAASFAVVLRDLGVIGWGPREVSALIFGSSQLIHDLGIYALAGYLVFRKRR